MLRIGSLVMLLIVLGLLYSRARDPDTWRWLATDPIAASAPKPPEKAASGPTSLAENIEIVVSAANDTDPDEVEAFHEAAQAITDNERLTTEEMFAYWRLFDWARSETFAELWQRAAKDPLFAQLFEQPAQHRGELIALDLHIKRVLPHPPAKDETERPQVFEAWGATDDSRTFPYCLVFPDKPPQLPLGDNIDEEARFAGYFLKVMRYEDKLGKVRGAPLLIGRLQWRENPGRAALARSRESSPWGFWVVLGGFVAFLVLRALLRKRQVAVHAETSQPRAMDESAMHEWLEAAEGHEPPPSPSTNGHPPR